MPRSPGTLHAAPRGAIRTSLLLTLLGAGGAVAASAATLPPREALVVVGTVRAADGRPLHGAQVLHHGTSAGAQADAAGRYMLHTAARRGERITLLARHVGFTPVTLPVRVDADTIVTDFVLQPAVTQVSEVAVSAIGADAQAIKARQAAGYAGTASIAVSRAAAPPAIVPDGIRVPRERWNTEEYARIEENPFVSVRADPLSTFSIDVDRASYGNVRRFLLGESALPPKDAVRIEELVNYFTYDYPEPDGEHPVAVSTEVTRAPWKPEHLLVRVGLQTQRLDFADLPPNNLVFLIDVSGSMSPPNKLPLLKQAFRLLVNELRPVDRVAIVVYAGSAGVVLPSTPASEKERILEAIDRLEAGGSTAGGAGIRLAYDIAKDALIRGGNNRVILATDGDFNVGVSSTSELVRLVEERREQGTFLTVLGFGMGNLKDGRLEQLADRGNGNYAYIDDLLEARKVLVREIGGTLVTVAKDVKLQLEFNPRLVHAYRLIGYENRLLADADFDDDTKDAGEIGAGHSVTALYEVIPVGARSDAVVTEPPALRYQEERVATATAGADELLSVAIRYKRPDASASRLLRHVVRNEVREPSPDLGFAAAVAGFGMLLRESAHVGEWTLADVRRLAEASLGADPEGERRGFLALVRAAERLQQPAVAEERGGSPR